MHILNTNIILGNNYFIGRMADYSNGEIHNNENSNTNNAINNGDSLMDRDDSIASKKVQ